MADLLADFDVLERVRGNLDRIDVDHDLEAPVWLDPADVTR